MAESVAMARIGSFQFMSVRAILAKCLGTAYPRATALHSANCRPIFMSCRVRCRASAARSNTTLRPGASSDDWPARGPVTDAEIDVFEAWFGDLFDELLGPCR